MKANLRVYRKFFNLQRHAFMSIEKPSSCGFPSHCRRLHSATGANRKSPASASRSTSSSKQKVIAFANLTRPRDEKSLMRDLLPLQKTLSDLSAQHTGSLYTNWQILQPKYYTNWQIESGTDFICIASVQTPVSNTASAPASSFIRKSPLDSSVLLQ